jgi:hypothetical protein
MFLFKNHNRFFFNVVIKFPEIILCYIAWAETSWNFFIFLYFLFFIINLQVGYALLFWIWFLIIVIIILGIYSSSINFTLSIVYRKLSNIRIVSAFSKVLLNNIYFFFKQIRQINRFLKASIRLILVSWNIW